MPEHVHAQQSGRVAKTALPLEVSVEEVETLKGKEWHWLDECMKQFYADETILDLCEGIHTGRIRLVTIEGDAEGLIITNLYRHRNTNQLFISAMAGKNFLKCTYPLYGAMAKFAKNLGCRWIGGEFLSNSHVAELGKALKPMRKVQSVIYEVDEVIKEAHHGRR